jgi:hypothetical protein
MYFFPNKETLVAKKNITSNIPSHEFIKGLREEGALYKSLASEVCVGDIVFDINFLEITSKEFNQGSSIKGFHFEGYDRLDLGYHAYIADTEYVNVVNPELNYMLDDYHPSKIETL